MSEIAEGVDPFLSWKTIEIPLLPAALLYIQEKSYLPKIERIFEDFLKMQFSIDITKEPGLSQAEIDELLMEEISVAPPDYDLKVVAKFTSNTSANSAKLGAIIVTIRVNLLNELEKIATHLKFSSSTDMMTELFVDFLHIWHDSTSNQNGS